MNILCRILFFLIFFPSITHAETWFFNSTSFDSFGACWSWVTNFDDWGCPRNERDMSNGGTVSYCLDSYVHSGCPEFNKQTYCCTHTREGGNCPAPGTPMFPLDEGYENPTGNFDESQNGSTLCNEQPAGTSCAFHVECAGGECSAEYTGAACDDDSRTVPACVDPLTDACADACGEHGYSSEGCPDNACDTDPQGLSCLNQCTFHDWDNCPTFPSSSSATSATSTASSGGTTTTSSSGGTTTTSSSGGETTTSSGGTTTTTSSSSTSTSTSSSGSASGGESCASPPECDGDPIQCAQLIQIWRARCEYTDLGTLDLSAPGLQPVVEEEIEVDAIVENEILNQESDYVAACPAPITFTALGHVTTFSYQFVCDFALAIHDIVILVASILAFFIVGRFFQGGF